MDFAQPHNQLAGPTVQSNLKPVPTPATDTDPLTATLRSASNAALATALGSSTFAASDFPESHIPRQDLITPGALVVIFETYESLSFVYAARSAVFSNRNGVFHHDDFIGKPFGSKLQVS